MASALYMYMILAQFSFPSQYASVEKNGEHYMSPEDFVSKFLHAHTYRKLSKEATVLLAGVVDQTKDGLVFISIAVFRFYIPLEPLVGYSLETNPTVLPNTKQKCPQNKAVDCSVFK